MSNATPSTHPPRVLFFGMQGKFSYAPLHALLEAGIRVCAVIIPSEQVFEVELPAIQKLEQTSISRNMLPVLNSSIHSSILALAKDRNIPVWKVRQLSSSDTINVLTAYQPDIICVACFSKRIPRVILDIPRFACLNVHPSLLPANRGPEPLFWTFREGSAQTGVTIHLIDEGLDSGAIVAQEAIEIPDGISYSDLEELSAQLGGTLLVQSVWHMYNQELYFKNKMKRIATITLFPVTMILLFRLQNGVPGMSTTSFVALSLGNPQLLCSLAIRPLKLKKPFLIAMILQTKTNLKVFGSSASKGAYW